MVSGAVADGHLIGDLLAFGMTLLMAIMMLIIRQQHETPMLPAACLSALLCPLVVWPFAAPFDITATDLLKLFLFGTTQFGLGLVFLVVGGRLVSAIENALINTLELPLAVAWVWVCFNETPAGSSLIGGIIVIAAVAGHVWYSSRSGIVSATG
jgi:drug/metabolite transporter (DMT)-like permease